MSTLTEQQQRAVQSIDSNVLVSAGAGSGKTHVLVERYIEILKQKPDLKVSNLLAVTYTNKAAREMRTRLKARMEEMIAAAIEAIERDRWSVCRTEIDSARIGTIHSLCDSILKSFPARAGIDPRFEVLDELDRAELLRKSIDRTMLEAVTRESDQHEILLAYPVEQVRDWSVTLLKSSIQFQEALAGMPGLTADLLQPHCRQLLSRLQTRAVKEVFADSRWSSSLYFLKNNPLDPANKLESVRAAVVLLSDEVEDCPEGGVGEQIALLKQIAPAINLKVGGNLEAAKAIKESLKELRSVVRRVADLPEDLVEADAEGFRCLAALVGLAQRAFAAYNEMKRAHQKLDFNDLITAAFDLLKEPDSVARRYYNEEIKAILVDEFQDTNRMQSQLLSYLAGKDTRMFLIGDDKQSIYKFQGADVSTFNEWKRYLSGVASLEGTGIASLSFTGPSLVEKLSKSFRSHPGIVEFVNGVFEQLLSSGEDVEAYRASHQPLVPSRSDDPATTRIDIVMFNAATEEDNAGRRGGRELEARAVASWIEQKMQDLAPVYDKTLGAVRPIGYGDFAILAQRNDDFAQIEPILADRGIPYVTMGGSGFLNRQEVYDLENLLQFLGSPEDSQALFGALRSPLFGVTDDTIHALAAGQSGSLWSKIKRAAEEQGPGYEVLQPAVAVLKGLRQAVGRLPLDRLVCKVLDDTRFDVVLMGLHNGRQRSRNVWKFVSLAAQHSHLSVTDFVHSLASMRELKVKQSAAPVDSGQSVKLMTIHSSKGLEFPAVALPVLGQDAGSLSGKLLFHREYGIAFDTTRDKDQEKPTFFRLASLLEKDMSIAEKKRLLYVAMTRPRDYLGLFLEQTPRQRESFQNWVKAVLGLSDEEAAGSQFIGQLKGAPYCVSFVDRKSVADWQRSLKESGISKPVQEPPPVLDMSLLDPMPAAKLESQHRKASARVTPGPETSIASTIFGDYFHKLMERIANRMERPGETVMIDVAMSELGLVHPQIVRDVVADGRKLLDMFFTSTLFELMSRARRRLNECPFITLDAQGLKNLRTDLLVEDNLGQWHIIDYKTDQLDKSQVYQKINEHREQIQGYVEGISGLTGVTARGWLYFARLGELCEVT